MAQQRHAPAMSRNPSETATFPGVHESRRDGAALRALRAGAIAAGGRQTGYIFLYTAEKRMGSNLGPAD